MDESGRMSVGTSSNGLRYQVHGHVGMVALPGHGVGAAVTTGDGDVMMLYAPTAMAVSLMEQGMDVKCRARL